MRKWLVEETGEYRPVSKGDIFHSEYGLFSQWMSEDPSNGSYSIVKITELEDLCQKNLKS